MELLAITLIAAIGLVFGSFLNVCISRLPHHRSIVRPRSHCPHCGAAISARDNIPLLSFFLLRRRCRSCRGPIAWRYPAIELATAALWLLCWLRYGPTLQAGGMAMLCFLLLGLAAMDAETMRLPDAFTLPGIFLGILYSGLIGGHFRSYLISAVWAAAAAAILLAISGMYWLVRRRFGMGVGDAKLIAMIATWLGPGLSLLVLFLAFAGAAIYGIAISLARRRFEATAALPFGSFLCAAAIYTAFRGNQTLVWYLGYLR